MTIFYYNAISHHRRIAFAVRNMEFVFQDEMLRYWLHTAPTAVYMKIWKHR